MGIEASYVLSQFIVDRTADLVLTGLTDTDIDPGVVEGILFGDGVVDPTFIGVNECRPVVSFSTTALAALLAESANTFLLDGLALGAAALGKCWLQKTANAGARASGAVNVMMVINEGLLIPTQIQAVGNDSATIACQAITTWDGANAPLVLIDSQAMVGVGGGVAAHCCGPVKFNGEALDGVLSIRISTGIQVRVRHGDGEVYPTQVVIMRRQPRFSIELADAGVIVDLGLTGKPQATADSVVYLRSKTSGGTRDADNAGTHISFTIDEGLAWVENIRGGDGDFSTPTVVLQPVSDKSNAIVVVSAAANIA